MKKLIIMISFTIFLITNAYATNYYVDNTGGVDSNSGTSPSAAWKSIAKVNATMSRFAPGDNILFKRGETWRPGTDQNGVMITCLGNASNFIVFDAYGTGEKPIISFAGEMGDGRYSGADEVCMYISNSTGYITIRNFQFKGAANNMAVEFTGYLQPQGPIYIEYCDFTGDGYPAEALLANNFSNDSKVTRCTFDASANYSKAVEIKDGENVTVSNCIIKGYGGGGGIRYSNHANDGIIENNYIYYPILAQGICWAIVYRSADTGGIIRNNIIDLRGTTLSNKNLRGITGWLGENGRKVYNNTIIGDGHGSAFKIEDLNWEIKNNLVINVDVVFNISSSGGATAGRNAHYQCRVYSENDNLFTDLGQNITTDPLVKSYTSLTPENCEAVQLQNGSPLVNAGTTTGVGIPSTDIWCSSRSNGVDIGAFELETATRPKLSDIKNIRIKTN